jgi:hypothetical protein
MSNSLSTKTIQNKILSIRGLQVILDRDLAELYHVDTKVLNQSVKRNIDRFPFQFRFQLTEAEKKELVTNCDRFESLKHSPSSPFAFTEQGVAMLSAVLRSDIAVRVSIQIMDAFVQIRRLIGQNTLQQLRLFNIENKLIEHDQKFDKIFMALESKELPQMGIFFDGQVFNAWQFVSDLVRSAQRSIILIDNYIDDTVLLLFSKRRKGVTVTLLTKNPSPELKIDIQKFNKQYEPLTLKSFNDSHDRFLIIDETDLYYFGASLKDLGKKWFAFSKMEIGAIQMLDKLKKENLV